MSNAYLSPLIRFEAKVQRGDGCWEWLGWHNKQGYALFHVGGHQASVHRFAYETFVSPIPSDKEIDHLCRNRGCVRPDHLQAVTHRVNVLRGEAPTAQQARRTHCPKGHEYTAENGYLYRGKRYCRACWRVRPMTEARRIGQRLRDARYKQRHPERLLARQRLYRERRRMLSA